MNESFKEHQAQIRLTAEQYIYLNKQKKKFTCSTSAYFRSLLVKDMNTTNAEIITQDKGGE